MVLSLSVRLICLTLLVFAPLNCLAETVLLAFSSPTCGPCQQMRPVVQRLAADGFRVQEIDISRDPQTAAQFGVTQVPTFIVLVDRRPTERVVGTTSYQQLREMLLRGTPIPAPRRRAVPQGQSPDQPSTFAPQQASVATVAGPNIASLPSDDLSQPQAGRVVALEDPSARPSRPSAVANPFGNVPARPIAPVTSSPNSLHQRLLASTVKITVEDAQGKSAGTGTIVDARNGEALILTCGHIFRSSAGKGPITVTTFRASATGATPGASYSGHLIDFDLERDLALVSMRPTSPVQAVSIAGTEVSPLTPNTSVTSVGCNHGQNPTAIDSRVTSINRYQGTPNVEVAGAPVEGRSGGGLFNAQGQLVGVCYAADPPGNEGLYAALPAIYAKLDSLNLSMIYQPPATAFQVAQASAVSSPQQPVVEQAPLSAVRGQEPEAPQSFATTPAANPLSSLLPPDEQAALEEIQRRGINSEVICIIRPQDPTGKSEVITLNNASPAFVRALAAPTESRVQPTATASVGQLLH